MNRNTESAATGGGLWRDYPLETGQAGLWRVGALALAIRREAREWRLDWRYVDEGPRERGEVEVPAAGSLDDTPDTPPPEHRWIAMKRTADRLKLVPALPDRALVTRLDAPLTIPGGEEVTVYVGLPLWLRAVSGAPPYTLIDLPLVRLSDTWFGPMAGEGELCYAGRARANLDLANLPHTDFRARAAVGIRNRSGGDLSLETLRLPVNNLSLFAGRDGRLWTQAITLLHEAEGAQATLELGKTPHGEEARAALIAGPRIKPRKRITFSAFGSLLLGGIDALRPGKSRSAGMADG